MRIATSLLPLTKAAARSTKLSGLACSGDDFSCYIFPGLESGIAVLHFVIIRLLKLGGTSGKSGMHRKRKHPNKREKQTNPFVCRSQFGHAAHPAGTESQTASRNNTECLCTILFLAFYMSGFEVGRPEAVGRRQGKQWWSLARSHSCEASTLPEGTMLGPNLQATQQQAWPPSPRTRKNH